MGLPFLAHCITKSFLWRYGPVGTQVTGWERGSDADLLKTPLRHLDLSPVGGPVEKGIRQLGSELRGKEIGLRPHFWVSDEWFCPDGIPGIAVPFYLLHPRLIELETQFIGYAEGSDHGWLMKLLRHEMGHVMENAYKLRHKSSRVQAFGSSEQPYPRSYCPQPYSRRFVRHLEDNYSQSHPDEDFAETFAVWLTPGSQWRQKYRGWGAMEKLRALDQLMAEIKGAAPVVQNKRVHAPLSGNHQTLGQYFKAKQKRLGLLSPEYMDSNLQATFFPPDQSPSGQKAARFLQRHRHTISQRVAGSLGEPQYLINQVVDRLSRRAQELGLRVGPGEALEPVLDVVAVQALEDMDQKRHYISL